MSRVAIVTGGTLGIGREISESLARAGYRVAANFAHNAATAAAFNRETGIAV